MNALVIAFFAVVAIVAAAPASPPSPGKPVKPGKPEAHDHEEPIAIISQTSDMYPDGTYNSGYETANGIVATEEGTLQKEGDEEVMVVKGTITYTAPDGTEVKTTYTAGKDGFHASGDHLPTPPPTPEYIARALEWNLAHPLEEEHEEEHHSKSSPKKM